ncbi:MAG: hypothetical protein WCK51_12025 [Armatimonadota bacterium]
MLSTALFVFSVQASTKAVAVRIGDTELTCFNWKPEAPTKEARTLFVFHGTDRNAQEYGDHTIPLAAKVSCALVAPLFDKERFPNWRYHRGGIQDAKGNLQARIEWTYTILEKLLAQTQGENTLIGHSAGGQFLNRMCAFAGTSAKRVIVANPGSVIFPRSDWSFPFGMGGLSPALSSEEAIKSYLAQPMTFLLGTADNKPDENFDTSKDAMRQGGGRLQRSTNCFNYGKALAQRNGWHFNWGLVQVPGIGHDHEKMFNSFEAIKAFER